MFRRFLPETVDFFALFEEQAAVALKTSEALLAMTEPGASLPDCASKIKDLERAADDAARRCVRALQRTFITPFDRTQIKSLISAIDDIVDSIDEAASRIVLFEIQEMRPDVRIFADILIKATTQLCEALNLLRNLKNEAAINQKCVAVLRLENEGDVALRAALMSLFKETKDPVLIIKWKEVFEHLEEATDGGQDVANIINGIVIEAS